MQPKQNSKLVNLILGLMALLVLSSCGGDGGSDSGGGTVTGGGTGRLSTSLTDSSTDEYKAVYVTITRVDVHLGGNETDAGNWQTVATPNKTYPLLELVNGARETLGIATMDAGHYTQMRLIIGETLPESVPPATPDLNIFSQPHPYANYVIDMDDDEIHPLKVPSGPQTGLKVVNGFEIYPDQTTELILDFDASRSVVKAGKSGNYLLKPTVKVLTTDDYAIVSGTVTDASPVTTLPTTPTLLPGTLVTAQTTAPQAADIKDQVVIDAGTVTNGSGNYTLFLKPANYTLVATKGGYLPECAAVSLVATASPTVDFGLEAASSLISIDLTIAGLSVDQYATIDFRQTVTCNDAPNSSVITVKSLNLANGVFSFELPAGSYQVVASSYGEATQSLPNVTIDTTPELLEITFP